MKRGHAGVDEVSESVVASVHSPVHVCYSPLDRHLRDFVFVQSSPVVVDFRQLEFLVSEAYVAVSEDQELQSIVFRHLLFPLLLLARKRFEGFFFCLLLPQLLV